ncbi:hypothetical protein MMC07_008956 [Pseudocyphellaria aurata]|nr:hypothetical protein [Pseudocyphellaria aurata]
MGRAKASREGNYASSNCLHKEDNIKLELGLTLHPGSQTQKGGSNILKRVVTNGKQTHGQEDVNQEQEDFLPIGYSHEARSFHFISSYFALNSQRGHRILKSPALAHQHDEKTEVGNRGALFRQSPLTARDSDGEINIMIRRRSDGPSVSTCFENDDHTIKIKDEGHDGNGGTWNHPYPRRSRKKRRVESRCHINQNFRSCINRTSQTRKVLSHSIIFEALNHLDICKAVPFNVFDVPSLHISAVQRPRAHLDFGKKIRLCALSTGIENETTEIGKIGQKDTVKIRLQPRRHRGEKCAKALEWNNVDRGEGLKAESDGGSDSLKSASASASAFHICEMYMANNFDGSLVPEPGTVQVDSSTCSTETVSDEVEVSLSLVSREKAPSVLVGSHGRYDGDGTKIALKRVSPMQPEAFGRRLIGASDHRTSIKVQKTLVPGFKRDDNCVNGKLLVVSSSSTHSSSSSSLSCPLSSSSSSHPSSPSSLRHPIFTAPTAPFKLNIQRQASILTTSVSTSHSLCASRNRSTSLPDHRFVKSPAAMDYHPSSTANGPFQYHPRMFSEIPDKIGWRISTPPCNSDASLDSFWQQKQPNMILGPDEWNSPSSSSQQKHVDRFSNDLHDINNAIYARSHHEDLTARVSHFVNTFPLDHAAHQIPMDVAYAKSVNEVNRLQARVQKLQRDNGALTEKVKRCNQEKDQMQSRGSAYFKEAFKRLESKAKEIEDQRAETQTWKLKFEQLYTMSRQSGPKRSSAVRIFETVGRFTPETNFIPQPVLPVLKPVLAKATETNGDFQFTADARSLSDLPEPLTLASATAIQAQDVADTTCPLPATPIDLTVDEPPAFYPISPASSVSPPVGDSFTAQHTDPIQKLGHRVRHGAVWMGEAHPLKRPQNPAAQRQDIAQPKKRVRLLDTAMLAQGASIATAEVTKTEAKKNSGKTKVKHPRAPVKPTKPSMPATQRKKEQEQRNAEQARESDREAKLRDDLKRGQDMADIEKEKEEVKSQARNREEQLPNLRAQEGSLETRCSNEDSLAYLFEDDENLFQADGGEMDWEGQGDDDGLEAELSAAMAREAERGIRE